MTIEITTEMRRCGRALILADRRADELWRCPGGYKQAVIAHSNAKRFLVSACDGNEEIAQAVVATLLAEEAAKGGLA